MLRILRLVRFMLGNKELTAPHGEIALVVVHREIVHRHVAGYLCSQAEIFTLLNISPPKKGKQLLFKYKKIMEHENKTCFKLYSAHLDDISTMGYRIKS